MRHLPVAVLICGGCAVVIAGDWRGDTRLLGLGFLIALAGVALGIALRPGPAPEKVREFADDFDRQLPSGGTGRVPTSRSATIGLVYATVTALCWVGFLLLGGKVGASAAQTALSVAGALLLLGGWLERLSRIWGWRRTAAWVLALPLSIAVFVPLGEWPAGLAFGAVLMYGGWTWPGIQGWERPRRRRRKRPSRPGRRARRRRRRREREA